MLRVVVKREKGQITRVDLVGHADYDQYGKDIVCSSASSIMTTTVNAILRLDSNFITYKQQKDHVVIILNKQETIVGHLMENMVDLLKELATDYPKNIKIEEE